MSIHELVESAGGFRNLFAELRNNGVDLEREVTNMLAKGNPIFGSSGFRVTRLLEGEASITFPISEQILRTGGIVHGGVIMYALDSALGLAVMTQNEGVNQFTLELKVNFLEQLKDGPFQVTGRVVRMGRNTAVAEGEVTDAAGKICAKALGTWFIIRSEDRPKSSK